MFFERVTAPLKFKYIINKLFNKKGNFNVMINEKSYTRLDRMDLNKMNEVGGT